MPKYNVYMEEVTTSLFVIEANSAVEAEARVQAAIAGESEEVLEVQQFDVHEREYSTEPTE